MDSTGLGSSSGGSSHPAAWAARCGSVTANDRVLKVFAITGLDKVFEIHPDVDGALAAE